MWWWMWNSNKHEQLYIPTADKINILPDLQYIWADIFSYSVEVFIAIHYIIFS